MSESVSVAIGVVDGKVVARWHQPLTEIVFDAKNAYSVGMHLSRAAMEAHQGKPTGEELSFIAGELAEVRKKVTSEQRMAMVMKASHDIRSMLDQGMNVGRIAVEIVDSVLAETAR